MSRRHRPLPPPCVSVLVVMAALLLSLGSAAPLGFVAFGDDQLPSPFYRELGQLGPAFGPLRPPPPPDFHPADRQPGFYHHFIGHHW